MASPSACPEHQALVARALDPDAPDEVLERFADEVPSCDSCRRELARDLQVHPVVLSPRAQPASLDGMEDLYRALATPPPRTWPRVAAVGAAALLAAAATWLFFGPVPSSTAPPPVADAPPAHRPHETEEPIVEAPAPGPAPAPVVAPERAAPPVRVPPGPAPLIAEAPAPATPDWPPPTFVELRAGTIKGSSTLRSAQLVLGGTGPGRHVGDVVELTVVSSASSEVAVCVSGPEQGIVWRGGIPAGRVALTQAGRDVSFAFAAPGTYRFLLSTDVDGCSDPVHIVEVEVRG